jgi:coronin-1B/1C/6
VEGNQFDGWGAERWQPIDFDPVQRVDASPRKIGQVLFHPTASNVLACGTGEHTVKLFDLGNVDNGPRTTLVGHTDTIQCLEFDPTGTLLVTTCRDRKLRMFDPRTGGEPVRVAEGHGGVKGARIAWMGDTGRIATTGFSKMSDRQLSVWDSGNLTNMKTLSIDQSAGVLMPFWSDNGILFLAGKG